MQLIDPDYPKSHVTAMMGLNALSVLVGLAMVAGPFAKGFYPGSFDTTVHVALGALIFAPALFRVLLAYGSIWVDVVLFVLGFLVFMLPTFQHMLWNPEYKMGHMIGGGIVMAVAVISTLLTLPVLKKARTA